MKLIYFIFSLPENHCNSQRSDAKRDASYRWPRSLHRAISYQPRGSPEKANLHQVVSTNIDSNKVSMHRG
ncbi:unnamed protein product [Acanthoscelides obtectus]|uniref:Uncharacterized protein n=1 Tax=Acanthoscelides obtectus TaxID=200917 RepID=A0A9P0KUX8_ACAOB|nr:unnamed protein product [Acanthoscelides obtectus]CAK1628604.1 hypothetical protein AOBTE_LOCUS5300 [Acanthoscelides obtectus]